MSAHSASYISKQNLQNQPKSVSITDTGLTLKITTAQVVETSVTNNSFSKDYSHPDDHAKHVTDTGFSLITKPLSWCTHDLKAC